MDSGELTCMGPEKPCYRNAFVANRLEEHGGPFLVTPLRGLHFLIWDMPIFPNSPDRGAVEEASHRGGM
jgi:hypothetical protein